MKKNSIPRAINIPRSYDHEFETTLEYDGDPVKR
jgi:hypothetical protein